MSSRCPVRLKDLARCHVCGKGLTWPSLYFCGPSCSEAWVRRAREAEGDRKALPKGEPRP